MINLFFGTHILDTSNIVIMKFHYEVINKHFGNYNLTYYDTDSFVYNIQCDDLYKWRQHNKYKFYLSDDKFNKDDTNTNTQLSSNMN